jgi:HIV Tat-specific factor 1
MADPETFPHDEAEFAQDDRISFSTTDNKYLLVDENNQEWEFNALTKAWAQAVSSHYNPDS